MRTLSLFLSLLLAATYSVARQAQLEARNVPLALPAPAFLPTEAAAQNVVLKPELACQQALLQQQLIAPTTEACTETETVLLGSYTIPIAYLLAHPHFAIWEDSLADPYPRNFGRTPMLLQLRSMYEKTSYPTSATSISSGYGSRNGRMHYGVDLRLSRNTAIRATFDGIVRVAKYDKGYGNYIVIRHLNGLETLYGHLARQFVKPGEVVTAGDIIGLGGTTGRSTGPHLHFEVHYAGKPLNPRLFFDFEQQKPLAQQVRLR